MPPKKVKSKKSKKKDEDIESMLNEEEDEEDEEEEDEEEEEDNDDLEEEDEEDEDEDDGEDEEEDEEAEEEDEEDEDESEGLTPETINGMKKNEILEMIEEEDISVKRPKGTKLKDLKLADLRKRTIAAIPWEDEEEEEEEDEDEPKTKRKTSTTAGLGENPKYKKSQLLTDLDDAPVKQGSKRWAGVRAMMEEPRTLADHQERAIKRHKAWKTDGEAVFTNVIDRNLVRDLRTRLGAVIEHDAEDGTFHILGFVKGFYIRVTNGSSVTETKPKAGGKKKKKAKK